MQTQSAWAIIEEGGKQHRVRVGKRLQVEKREGQPGDSIILGKVLQLSKGEEVSVGVPYLPVTVTAKIVGQGRGDKIIIFKLRRRKTYRRTQGHRQYFTEVEVTEIA